MRYDLAVRTAAHQVGSLPSGEVTFLFTDMERSTRLAEELGTEAFAAANDAHRRVVRAALAANGGVEVSTHGDAFFAVFRDPRAAAVAARTIQAELAAGELRVRIGLHTGTAALADGTYIGVEVNRAARIADAGHGGQIVVSDAFRAAAGELGPTTDLGEHRLKDIGAPVRIHQLGDGDFPPLRTVRRVPPPRPADTFVGREEQLRELVDLLDSGARLITLTGAGGTGKTRLALEAVLAATPGLPGGVAWVTLAAVDDAQLVRPAVAQALGAEAFERLGDTLGAAATLLVLDNAEHLVEETAAAVADALGAAAALRVLVTSRERLGTPGELVVPVPPLPSAEAVALFRARAEQAGSRLDGDPGDVTELCARLDDLPLAIELAAARTTLFTVAQLTHRLGDALDLLSGRRGTDARQATLRATIAWSYELLGEEERLLLRRLAIFVGGCSLDAAEDVAGARPDTLVSLADKSLVAVDRGGTESRFTLLETIRAFALGELAQEPDDRTELERRYVRFYLEAAAAADAVVRTRDRQLETIEWFARELGNLRHALAIAERSGDALLVARLTLATNWYVGVVDPTGSFEQLRRALELEPEDAALRVPLLLAAARAAWFRGQNELAWELADDALAAAEAAGDPLLIANALETKGATAGDPAVALELVSRGVRLLERLDHPDYHARAAINLGAMQLNAGAWEEAFRDSLRGLELVRELGNRGGIAVAAYNAAHASYRLGELETADRLVRESEEHSRSIGDEVSAGFSELLFAALAADRGDADAAAQHFAAFETMLTVTEAALETAEERLRDLVVEKLRAP
jgi:predicted ATPase/class 3 adenylate cyclase